MSNSNNINRFKSDVKDLNSLLTNVIYSIPINQRPYSWQKDQVQDLIEEFYNSYKNNKPLFLGSIYLELGNRGNDYSIVDGQQRLTTICLTLLALYCLQNIKRENSDILARLLWFSSGQEQLLTSGTIEKEALNNVFREAKNNPINIKASIKNQLDNISLNEISKNLYKNFRQIFNYFDDKCREDNFKLNELIENILQNTFLVQIIFNNIEKKEIFNIFEAINSKALPLGEIDLIKNYIFSELEAKDVERYLKIWGELIIQTNNNLEDYLSIYIKAFIKFQNNSIKIKDFKNLIQSEQGKNFFKNYDESSSERIKALLDNLSDNVNFYEALFDINVLKKISTNKDVELQFNIFKTMEYVHPRPVYFKALIEFKNDNNIKKLINILKNINTYLFTSLSIMGGDSKDFIPLFRNILKNSNSGILPLDEDEIQSEVKDFLIRDDINYKNLLQRLLKTNGYRTNLGTTILSIFQAFKNDFFSDDIANENFRKIKKDFDHILPRLPEQNNRDVNYYRSNNLLVIKDSEVNDFPSDISQGMSYNKFQERILDLVGNLRLLDSDVNSHKSNKTDVEIELKEFHNYNAIENRTREICNALFSNKKVDAFLQFLDEDQNKKFTYKTSETIHIAKEPVITTFDTFDEKKQAYVWDFNESIKLMGHKPATITIFDNLFSPKSWKDTFSIIIDELNRFFPNLFENYYHYITFNKKNIFWLKTNGNGMIDPHNIPGTTFWVELHRSIKDLGNYLISLNDFFQIKDKVTITYK